MARVEAKPATTSILYLMVISPFSRSNLLRNHTRPPIQPSISSSEDSPIESVIRVTCERLSPTCSVKRSRLTWRVRQNPVYRELPLS